MSFKYSVTDNKLYVYGGGSATLSNIKSALPGAPLTVVDSTNKIWLSSANLVVQDGSTLVLHGSSAGGDVNELRLLSLNTNTINSIVYLTADYGTLDVNGAKITSWDTTANAAQTNYLPYGRAYVLAVSTLNSNGVTPQNSTIYLTNSEVCFLGNTNSNQQGLTWKVSGTDPNPANNPFGVRVFGNVVNSRLHDSYIGAYTFGATNMVWQTNQIYNNAQYGLNLNDYSGNCLIQGNNFYNNGNHGFTAATACNNLSIVGNTANLNGSCGIELNKDSDENLLTGNVCVSNDASGISLDVCDSNTVSGNLLFENGEAGVRLTVGSANNVITNNQCATNKYGLYCLPGTGTPDTGDNGHPKFNLFVGNLVHDNSADPLLFTNSDFNTVATNLFTDVNGKLRFLNSVSNWLDGDNINTNLTVRTEGQTNFAASLYVRHQTYLELELVTNATAYVEDAQGRIYQPDNDTISTAIFTNGSVLTLAAATNVSTTRTIMVRDLYAGVSSGTAYLDHLIWSPPAGVQWISTPGAAGQVLNFTVQDLTNNASYPITRDSAPFTNRTANASGQLQFSDTSISIAPLVYAVGNASTNQNNPLYQYSAALNKIYVQNGVTNATLSAITNALPGVPLTLVDATNKIWLLSANLIVQDGSTLVLHGTAAGGDVNQLRLLSLNNGATNSIVYLEADYGHLDINGVKITSWDTIANAPDTNYLAYGRAYLLARSSLATNNGVATVQNSRMDITNSEICFLGDTNSNEQGLTWKVSGVDPNPANNPFAIRVFGNVVNSLLHDNYIGAYTFGATNMVWQTNQIYNNVVYGLNLNDYSGNCLIQGNNLYNNGDHGLTASSDCNNLTITGNTANLNGNSGIELNDDSDGSLVMGNVCVSNDASGISIDTCDSNTVSGNFLFENGEAGVRLTMGSADNLIQNNQSATNKYGLYSLPGTGTPDPGDNGHPKFNLFVGNLVHDNSSDPLLFTNSDFNTVATNSFTDVSGKLRFANSVSNWLDGDNINTNLSVRNQGQTNFAASLYVRHQTYLELELVTNATAYVEDAQGRIYQPDDSTISTAISSTGSVLPLTAATNQSTTRVIIVRDLYAGVSSGTAYLDHLVWSPPAGVQWTSTPGAAGQVLNFTVQDLTNNASYPITRNSTPFTNLTANASGQLQFSDTSVSIAPLVYAVGNATGTSSSYLYDPSLNKLYVQNGVTATLSAITNALPGVPLTLVDATNKIWLLSANLIVEDGSTLVLHGAAAGGDVNQLRLLSLSNGATNSVVYLEADYGHLDINGVKITSWDTTTNAPQTNYLAHGRAYVLARSSLAPNGVTAWNSRMDITNSEICFLGDTNSNEQGLVWKVSGADPNPANNPYGVQVYGNVVNSRLHDNYMGGYMFGALNMLWLTNQIYNNVEYGLDLQNYSDQTLIWGNIFTNNQDSPLLISDCYSNTVATNTFGDNSGTLRFEGGISNWLDGNSILPALLVVAVSDTNGPGSLFVRNQTFLNVELDTNSTVTFTDARGRIYQPTEAAVLTLVSPGGSVLPLTSAGVGSSTAVSARDLFATAASGTASLNQLVWNPPGNVQWTMMPGVTGQALTFTVNDLAAGFSYAVSRGGTVFTNLTANGSGQIQFADTAGSTNAVIYSLVEGTSALPRLTNQRQGNGLLISWTGGSATLQSTTNLLSPNWQNVLTTNGPVLIPPALSWQFFRVVQP